MLTKPNSPTADLTLFTALALGVGVVTGLLVTTISNSLAVVVILIGLLGVFAITLQLELGLMALVFMTYTRFSDVMIQFHGAPSLLQPFIGLLLMLILFRWLYFREHRIGWEIPLVLLGGYGSVLFLSMFHAADTTVVMDALEDFIKDGMIMILVILLLQRVTTLRWVIWALLAAGIFLGTISVYQQFTGTFQENYWGFGQATLEQIVGETHEYRITGPIGDPNFFAQILLVLVPLALERLWNEPKPVLRLFAAWALGVCILSIFFSFSRGGFLALILVSTIMIMKLLKNPLILLTTLVIALPLLQFLPAGYTDRLKTIPDAIPGLGSTDVKNEASFRGRTSAQLSAWRMFYDSPVLGVGVHNFPVLYQNYARELGFETGRGETSPHNLYLEYAAEGGLVGLGAFGLIVWFMFSRLHRAYHDLIKIGKAEYSSMVFALAVGTIGYLVAALFLHSSYPRFFWLLFAIGVATFQLARNEVKAKAEVARDRQA
jgi:putative inorganic carbon (hco3(-)) transporter